MQRQCVSTGIIRRLCLMILLVCIGWTIASPSALAVDDIYIRKYLKVTDTIDLPYNQAGETKSFTAADLSQGKALFKEHCILCHPGGTTRPNPPISLSLEALRGATPPRDNISNLVAFSREPMSYDGTDIEFICRQVSERWLSPTQMEQLAAFILRAAQVAPLWGEEARSLDR
ncbi:photosystem II cytochrome PsbV2 [Trichothermofontia sp.]